MYLEELSSLKLVMFITKVRDNNIIHTKGNFPSMLNRFEKNKWNNIKNIRNAIEAMYHILLLDSFGYKGIMLFFTEVL